MTFLIQHVMGLDGMPRRIYEYDNVGHLQLYNQISTVGSFILAFGVLVTVINVTRSLKRGRGRGTRPVGREHARVVHHLAPARQQLRRDPAGAVGRTDEGHPPRDRAAQLRAELAPGSATVPAGRHDRWAPRWRASPDSERPPREPSPPPSPRSPRAPASCCRDLLELTKPKVQSLLLLTTVASMYVAGDPSVGLVR